MSNQKENIHIREAKPAEALLVHQLLALAFGHFKSCYTTKAYDATVLDEARVLSRMQEGPIWLVFIDNIAVGTASAIITNKGLYIRSMAVDPSYQGRRLASLLLQTMEDYAAKKGIKICHLNTAIFLPNAIKLYQKYGFKMIENSDEDYNGITIFEMEKFLM